METDPTNWKALTNKADINANWIHKLGKDTADMNELLDICKASLGDLDSASQVQGSDKKSIEPIRHSILLKLAQMSKEEDEALKFANEAVDLQAVDPMKKLNALMCRMQVYMTHEKFNLAIEDGELIEEFDLSCGGPMFEKRFQQMMAICRYKRRKIPVTILTGFLGSGKTTLLNRILKENHGKRIAVIENEFGAVGVDDKLVEFQEYQDEAIIEVMNGCICCTVRQDLITTIKEMKEKYFDTNKLDYIIIETTGMADPAPIIQTFLIDEKIQEWTKIDSCITICDASQIVLRLEEDREEGCENEAVEQVCFADKIFLNKVDLCNREELDKATAKIREFNEQAPVEEVQFTNKEIPFSQILDQDGFSIERCLELDADLLKDEEQEHKHDSRIGTFSYKMEAEMTMKGANQFLGKVLQEKGANIYRMKGFLAIEGSDQKFVFHSVGMLTSCTPYVPWEKDEKRECVFVIIGKHLEQGWLEEQFKNAAVKPADVQEVKNKTLEQFLGK